MYTTKNESILTKDRFTLFTQDGKIIRTFRKIAAGEKVILSHYKIPPGEELRQLVKNTLSGRPHLVILGFGSFKFNFDLCKYIKKQKVFSYIPVLVISGGKCPAKDTIRLLEAGADDCVDRDINTELLTVRIRAILRRTAFRIEQEEIFSHKEILLNVTTHILTVKNKPVSPTPKEFDLLYFLMKNKGKVVSRRKLLEMVWELKWCGDPRTLNKHIETLRKKLGTPANRYIRTVEGIGYKFE